MMSIEEKIEELEIRILKLEDEVRQLKSPTAKSISLKTLNL